MSHASSPIGLNDWLSTQEGKLSVDVIETPEELIIRSAIAGVAIEDLDISLVDDTLTIRGTRVHPYQEHSTDQLHVQECHWGSFSRTIILPSRVDTNQVQATLVRGILTITMKKMDVEKRISVLNLEEF